MTGRVAAWLALTVLLDLTRRIGSDRLTAMGNPSVYAWQDELSAAEFQTAPDAAKQDTDQVRAEFVESLPAGSPAYDTDWTTRYGSKDRLIFVFSVVLDLEEDFDTRDYPTEAAARATADLRNRLVGTKVDHWGVYVVTVTGRARSSSDDCPRRTPQARGVACGHRKSPHEGWVPWSHPVSFISTSTSSLSCRL